MYERYLSVFKKHYPAKKIAPLLAIIISLSPFAIDTYLPVMPTMAKFFAVEIHFIELSIPVYLIGFACGQIIGGPISDNYGRKLIGVAGLSVFMLASIAIVFATSVEQLLAFRFIQAFGGGFGLVISAAIVRDLYEGKEAAKIFTLIGFIMMIAPLIAPTIGSVLLAFFNWQAIFILLAVLSFVQIIIIYFFIPETKRLRKVAGIETLNVQQVIKGYWYIVSNKNALPYLLAGSFVAAALFSFLTEISFLYIEYFHVSEQTFAWLFGLNIVSMMSFNRLNRYLLDFWQPQKILIMGLSIQISAALLLLLIALLHLETLSFVVVLLMIIIGSFGIIAPNNMACYMQNFPKNSGAANAINGSSQFLFGAFVGFLLSKIHDGTAIPMFALIFITVLFAFSLIVFSKKN